jgi:uncharacterized lipoprotein YehR (DUF1307 family)
MIRVAVVSLSLILLTGCGITSTRDFPERTGYVMVSKGEASLLYRAFVGGVDYCKAVQHNLEGVEFVGSITYDGNKCTVQVEAENCVR